MVRPVETNRRLTWETCKRGLGKPLASPASRKACSCAGACVRLGRHLQHGWGWGSVAGVRAEQDRVTGAHQLLPGTPKVNVAQSCLRDPTDYTVHGILQARPLE